MLHFSVSSSVTFMVQNLTVANGNNPNPDGNNPWPGGGISDGGGRLTVINSTFSGNRASAGGGIYSIGSVTVGPTKLADSALSIMVTPRARHSLLMAAKTSDGF